MLDLSSIDLKKYQIVDWGYTDITKPLTFDFFDHWVKVGHHGELSYLADDRKDKRENLSHYWPPTQSAIVFLFDYAHHKFQVENFLQQHPDWNQKKIAGYVFSNSGLDYHYLLSEYLNEIAQKILLEFKEKIPDLEYKLAMDVHPVLDRDLAYRAGLGWYGKNSMHISRHHGSFHLIGSILFNHKLDFSQKKIETDHCGQCTRCVDACPTAAITDQRTIVANRCISTFTIETFKEKEPPMGYDSTSSWIFGCDICQDVCPWNKRVFKKISLKDTQIADKSLSLIKEFLLKPLSQVLTQLEHESNGSYKKKFYQTSFERLGKKGMMKNIQLMLKKMASK